MTSVLGKRMRLRSADFRQILRPNTFLNRKSALCGRIFSASTEAMRRPSSDFPLHFDIKNIYQIRTEKENASARRLLPATLLELWPQVCRVKITFELLRTTSFFSTKTNLMKCFLKWIPMNSHVHLNKPQVCLNISECLSCGILRTKKSSKFHSERTICSLDPFAAYRKCKHSLIE